ncbi:uncharacterized protein PV09_09793 [Verruconis gallopava]|uniref:Uncharacterized protein n=1 Tax=Verruconis gallopava TaxID=253628 RepID=A0A0D1ZWG6_9PEZI|nr:uncharacterized protein PV09_09793 [Verruconis gallopava]KIV98374.1 hypothetical protein PV09_09793 [Verruconis gallopava]
MHEESAGRIGNESSTENGHGGGGRQSVDSAAIRALSVVPTEVVNLVNDEEEDESIAGPSSAATARGRTVAFIGEGVEGGEGGADESTNGRSAAVRAGQKRPSIADPINESPASHGPPKTRKRCEVY